MQFDHIRAVWLDLDGTLFDHMTAVRRAMRELRAADPRWEAITETQWFAEYTAANERLWDALRRGECSWNEVRVERFRLLLEAFGLPADRLEWMATFFLERYIAHATLLPGARETISLLRTRGWPVGVITDGSAEVQRQKLVRCGLDALVWPVITPDEAGCTKPDPAIFHYAAQCAGFPPSANLYAGDSWEYDVCAARDAGWHVVWVHPGTVEEHAGDVVCVSTIAELPRLLPNRPPGDS